MGKVLVTVRVENLEDLYKVDQGAIRPDEVRHVEVDDALVDTGATMLSMPARLIRQLGLKPLRSPAGANERRHGAGPGSWQPCA